MTFEVTILGSNSAIPAHGRHPTSQVINHNENLYMIDCGEGTQMQLSNYKVKRSKINHIFISHLHGDHYYGLMGLITSYHLLQRTEPLTIYAPRGLREIIELNFKYSDTRLKFPLSVIEIDTGLNEVIYENSQLSVSTIPMKHRIPCYGFLFKEKKSERRIDPEKLALYKIPLSEINKIKTGNDFNKDGIIIPNSELTHDPHPVRRYACCSDTLYQENCIPIIRYSNLLYHESTFMNESAERALQTFHSTTLQAAEIAKKASVKKLLIGHFSAKYPDLNAMLQEARDIFPETSLAIEGEKFQIT